MSLESLKSAEHSMKMLIHAANENRALLDDTGWQNCMVHLNKFLKRYKEEQEKHSPSFPYKNKPFVE